MRSTSFTVAVPGVGDQRTRLGDMPPKLASKSSIDSNSASLVAPIAGPPSALIPQSARGNHLGRDVVGRLETVAELARGDAVDDLQVRERAGLHHVEADGAGAGALAIELDLDAGLAECVHVLAHRADAVVHDL